MSLSLKLLGEFELRDEGGAALSLPTRKTRALLGYLAANADKPQPRERLMALLWSDRGERQARQSLNQALLSIRKLVDSEDATLLDSDGERVTLRGEAVDCDVVRLRALIQENPAEAATIYEGPFLDGLLVPDPAFEEWLLATRSDLHALACNALETAAAGDNTATAIDCARRLVALDPLREEGHRRLMHLLHQSGDRTGALRQYQACAEILQRELQVEPDAATKALFETIRQDDSTPKEAAPATGKAPLQSPEAPAPDAAELPPLKSPQRRPWLVAGLAMAFVLVIGGGMSAWLAPWPQTTDSTPHQKVPMVRPDKPSIAVLPFRNLSDDPQQEYFSDGMTDDLITDLTKVSGLFVIARNSTFPYKGREIALRKIGQEIGARYVLEGSVRRISDQIRINAQLIDTVTGRHVWSERFDGNMTDVFSLQDTVNRKIVSSLAVSLTSDDRRRLRAKAPVSPDAYDMLLRGLERLHRFNQTDVIEARNLFRIATEIEPGYARAYGNVAWTYTIEVNNGWTSRREEAIRLATEYAAKAFSLDKNNAQVHVARASLFIAQRKYDAAMEAALRVLDLQPNYANGYAMLTFVLVSTGKLEEALDAIRMANHLNPRSNHIYLYYEGQIRYLMGRYKEAIPFLEEAIRRNPSFDRQHLMLAATYAQLGNMEKAAWSIGEALSIRPSLRLSDQMNMFKRPQEINRYVEGLRKAGLPE